MKKIAAYLLVFFSVTAHAQVAFSLGTNVSLLRNFSPGQQFWSLGQTVLTDIHFSPKQSAYVSFAHYAYGRFNGNFMVSARSSSTSPSILTYNMTGKWSYNQLTLGWKHYIIGDYSQEKQVNLYSLAGLGYMFTKVLNSYNSNFDTSLYNLSEKPLPGPSQFRRLTVELGAGTEFPVGGNFFFYGQLRTWIPASDYPSPYLFKTRNVPLPLMIDAGIRILLDTY